MFFSAHTQAQLTNRFDLTGPRISVHVTRGDKSLPIALVPNLQAGDKLTIHADLPKTQSVKLILVVAFLRGSTNPPPDKWFTELKTWDKKFSEGVTVTVPQEAQQALLFLAPETGGDFSTLKSAVTGRPGTFVRASQDLNEASFEQARIERYVQALQRVPEGSPSELLDHSRKLASTLNLKPNDDCFKKPVDQQTACLRQTGTQLLLDDGHGQTLASMLTTGDSANLIGAVAGTPAANSGGMGSYSAYVGTVIDVVRLMSGIHTAHFQYIPAIAFPDADALNLRLNVAPSFHDPKSVIVVALPAIQSTAAPPLHLRDPNHVSCLLQPDMVLPLEGAPLVFATAFAHDLVLHLNNGATLDGKSDLPLIPDAFEGGLVAATDPGRRPLPAAIPEARDAVAEPKPAPPAAPSAKLSPGKSEPGQAAGDLQITGTLRGMWGFDTFSGVTVPLQRLPGGGWTAAERSELFAGRANQLRLRADATACTQSVALDTGGRDLPLQWKQADQPRALDVSLPLEKAAPGSMRLLVHQYGTTNVDKVAVTAYSDKTRLEAAHIHAGDAFATLTGTGLGGVTSLKIAGADYKPTEEQPADGKSLRLARTPSKDRTQMSAGDRGKADVLLADGRTVSVPYAVDAARPSLSLLSRNIRLDDTAGLPLALSSKDDLPLNARITLALRSESPARFPRSEKLEVALADGSLKATLSLADGSIVLQDSRTALAYFNPGKTFGPSAFGPLQARAVADDGSTGDWIPLGTLVRTPVITAITCARPAPHAERPGTRAGIRAVNESATTTETTASGEDTPAPQACQITGKDLFLLASIAPDAAFTAPTEVPLGFAGETLPVPRPTDNRTLYLKLRDDPNTVTILTAPATLAAASRRPSAPAASPGTESATSTGSPDTPASAAPMTSPTASSGEAPAAPTTQRRIR